MNPAKQVVTASLKSLSRQRFKELCTLKRLRTERAGLALDIREAKARLEAVQNKIRWEVNTHSKLLGGADPTSGAA